TLSYGENDRSRVLWRTSVLGRGISGCEAGPSMDDERARGRVLDAAGRLFNARGIHAVGMDAIRAESGISLKRLYQLFPAKEAIIEQVLLRRHETWMGWVDAATRGAEDPRERLLAIYDMLARWFARDDFRGCLFINSFGELGGVSPRIAGI